MPKLVAGTADGDESGRRRPERHRADLDAADDLVLQPLVVHLDVIVAGEVALGVEVDVDVHPLPEQAGCPDR